MWALQSVILFVFVLTLFGNIVTNSATSTDNPPDLMLANSKDIRRVRTEEKNTEPVVQNLQAVESLDFDVVNNQIYWADMSLKKISRAFVNGSSVEEIAIRALQEPRAIIIDWVGHNIIWSDVDPRMSVAHQNYDMGRLWMMTYDGKYTRAIVWKGLSSIWALAVNPETGFVYWSDSLQKKIERILTDGSNRSVVVSGSSVDGLTIDYEEHQLYWTEKSTHSIKLSDLDGSNQRTLIQSQRQLMYPYSIVTLGKYVYWTDMYKRAVLVAKKGNAKQKSIVEDQLLNPYDIGAFDKGRQPAFSSMCGLGQSGCSHFCLPIPPSYKCGCPTGVKLLADGKTCASGLEKFIVYARGRDIRILSLDVPLDETIDVISQLKTEYATDLDYDVEEDLIYWIDQQDNCSVIRRGNANSSTGTSEVVVRELATIFNGLAIDWISRNLYWMDTKFDRLRVSRLDGSYQKTLINTNLELPRAIVVDPVEGYMYWSDWGSAPRIEKACMDGSNRTVLIKFQIVWPNGLAIDYDARRLYWADAGTSVIESSDLWGGARSHLGGITKLNHPYGLTVSGPHVYWTDAGLRTIERADKTTGNNQGDVFKAVPEVLGIQAVDKTRPRGTNACAVRNGGCSHLCLPRPRGRSCSCPDYFVFSDAQQTQCTAPTPYLLYTQHTTTGGAVRKLTITDKPHGGVVPLPSQAALNPVALSYDIVEGKVYWSDTVKNEIRRANMAGEDLGMEVIASFGTANLGGLAVDWMGRNIYWTVAGHDRIDMARLDGSLRSPFKWQGVRKPMALTVEPEEGMLYWTTWGEKVLIQSARLTNSSDSKTITELDVEYQPIGLTIDHSTRRLFWTDYIGHSISMINLNDKLPVKIILLGADSRYSLLPAGISFFNKSLYWANLGTDRLEYSPISKSRLRNVQSLGGITGLNNDDKIDVIVVDYSKQSAINQCSARNGDCSDYCLSAKGNQYQCACPVYLELEFNGQVRKMADCRAPQSMMMYSTKRAVYFVNLTAPDATQNQSDSPLLLDIKSDIVNIEVDIGNSHIFWIDSSSQLHGSKLDGTGYKLLVKRGKVFDMAVNYVTGQVFYTNEESDTIEAVWPNGISVGVVINSQQLHPRSLTLDSNAGFLYWSDWGEVPSIRRAFLDEDGHMDLIRTNLVSPTGLTMDTSRGILYWIDWERQVMEACDAGGNNRRTISLGLKEFGRLAEAGMFLFYTMPSNGSIMRLNKSRNGDLPASFHAIPALEMRRGLVNVSDVYVYENRLAPENPCAVRNGNCSHLCIPTGGGAHRCACPVNRELESDHQTCSSPSCTDEDKVPCSDGSMCISPKERCDGEEQCRDGSDEIGCVCDPDESRCPTGECIPKTELCDGMVNPNCEGWDEGYTACPCVDNEKQCGGWGCFTAAQFCDGNDDCPNGYDELHCTNGTDPPGARRAPDSPRNSVALIVSCVTAGILIPLVILLLAVRYKMKHHHSFVVAPPKSEDYPASLTTAVATEMTNLGQDSSYRESGVTYSGLTEAALREKMEREHSVEGVSVYVEGLCPVPRMPVLPSVVTDGETDLFTMPLPMGGPVPKSSDPPCDPPNSIVSGQESAFTLESTDLRRPSRRRRRPSLPRYRYRSSESDFRPSAPCPSAANGSSSEGDADLSSEEDDIPVSRRSKGSRRIRYPLSPTSSFISDSRIETDYNSVATLGDFCPPPPPTVVSDYTETEV